MNRMDRVTATLLMLQEGRRTADEIASAFEVSRRTVLRDVQALCEMGVPVVAQGGPGGGYSLPEDYGLTPLPITLREAVLLLLSLSTLDKLPDSPFSAERASLAAKLRSVIPTNHLARADELLGTLSMQVPERRYRVPFVETLLESAGQGAWVEAEYRSGRATSIQTLLPRSLSCGSGFWYCRAYSHERGEERTYRIDRFVSVRPVDAPGASPASVPEVPYDHASHPEVTVRLTSRGVLRMETDPHWGDQIQPDGDGGVLTFRCPPAELEWISQFLLGFGADAEVLAPPELQNRISELASIVVRRYVPIAR